jgi:hypothetical protein
LSTKRIGALEAKRDELFRLECALVNGPSQRALRREPFYALVSGGDPEREVGVN